MRSPLASCLDTVLAGPGKRSRFFLESCHGHGCTMGFCAYLAEGGEIHLVFAQHQYVKQVSKYSRIFLILTGRLVDKIGYVLLAVACETSCNISSYARFVDWWLCRVLRNSSHRRFKSICVSDRNIPPLFYPIEHCKLRGCRLHHIQLETIRRLPPTKPI